MYTMYIYICNIRVYIYVVWCEHPNDSMMIIRDHPNLTLEIAHPKISQEVVCQAKFGVLYPMALWGPMGGEALNLIMVYQFLSMLTYF